MRLVQPFLSTTQQTQHGFNNHFPRELVQFEVYNDVGEEWIIDTVEITFWEKQALLRNL